MPVQQIFALGANSIDITNNVSLSGGNQGSGIHLQGQFITLTSNAWEQIDIDEANGDNNFGDSDNSQRLAGDQMFGGNQYFDDQRVEAEYRLTLRDPDGNEYTVLGFNINEGGGQSFATVEGLAFVGGVGGFPPRDVPLEVIETAEGPNVAYASLATPPCFTPDTLIRTPEGQVRAGALQIGDLVETMDHGPQPIRWIGRTYLPLAILRERPDFRPIHLSKDALGPSCPNRDTVLSPQHRVLLRDWRAALYYGMDEVLVPVKKLINDTTVRIGAAQDVTYIHLLFDQHQVIWGDGLPSESYLATDRDTAPGTADEIDALFPDMPRNAKQRRSARRCVSDKTARLLAS